MKQYGAVTHFVLPRRTYTIIRVDGRAFHALLRRCERPYDEAFSTVMNATALRLCQDISGTRLAYKQSDEISLIVTDFQDVHTEPWMGGVLQKMCSLAASIATKEFNRVVLMNGLQTLRGLAEFDARVFTIPTQVEVANYLIWRQRDCVRNSIMMAARACFPHALLQGKSTDEMQEMLFREKGINWSGYPDMQKRGSTCIRVARAVEPGTFLWTITAAPHFTAEPGSFLARQVPALPSLEGQEP